jgi:hypothetical protein
MAFVMEKKPERSFPREAGSAGPGIGRSGMVPDDGTRQLLRTGFWSMVVGVIAALLTATVFGGIARQGPHTNSGWLALIVAMMCLPFGFMLFALGAAKWLRNRRLQKEADFRR